MRIGCQMRMRGRSLGRMSMTRLFKYVFGWVGDLISYPFLCLSDLLLALFVCHILCIR